MGITIFQPSSLPVNEAGREKAVERSGFLAMMQDPVLQSIALEARRECGTAMAAISIVYKDWQYLVAAAGLPTGPYSRRTSFCGHVIVEPVTFFCVPDAQSDLRFANNPAVAADTVRFYAGAPLMSDDDFALGAICVIDPVARHGCGVRERDRLVALAARSVDYVRSALR